MAVKSQIQQAIDKINHEIALLVATRDRLVEAQRSQPKRKRRPAMSLTDTGAAGSAPVHKNLLATQEGEAI